MVSTLMFGLMMSGERPVKTHLSTLKGSPGEAQGDVNPYDRQPALA